jgi:triosephosphate isomerase
MNKTAVEAEGLIRELLPLVAGASAEVVLCVPFTDLSLAVKLTKGTNAAVGAQNVAWADAGAFTGEISAAMIRETGAKYVIIGHSERRQMFGETDETVRMRTVQALKNGLVPIVCIGETLAEREAGETKNVNERQFRNGLSGIPEADAAKIVIAYEPVWAIGTGKTATKEDAQDTIAFIRSVARDVFGKTVANGMRIQYGGSMNAANCAELMSMPDIDGGLIGGASLKAGDFSTIVKSAEAKF